MTAAEVTTVPGIRLEDIVIRDRARKDYGNLQQLADSILEHGLLQPIVLLPDNTLLCGGRRYEACRRLGWESIPFVYSTTQTDAISRLKAERDENTCRKDMTPSELVAIGKLLEDMKRPEAEERQRAAGREFGRGIDSSGPKDPELSADHNTRKEVADALGMSESTYKRAKRVVEAAADESADESVHDAAVAAKADMDAGKITITGAEKKIAQAQQAVSRVKLPLAERLDQIRGLADTGRTSGQIGDEIGIGEDQVRKLARSNGITITADEVLRGTRRLKVDHDHIVNHLVMTLEVVTEGLDRVVIDALDDAQIQNWADSLTTTTRALNRFVKRMKESTQ